ncbi:MAG: DUF7130 family rubredoxin-like protein [bacterium]
MPFAASTPTHYKCTNCGHILPRDRELPERCPNCGQPKEAYVLVEED